MMMITGTVKFHWAKTTRVHSPRRRPYQMVHPTRHGIPFSVGGWQDQISMRIEFQ
jgi:hypothetical protein